MEGNVDARKRDCREAALEQDVALGLLLTLRPLEAFVDDLLQHFPNFLNSKCLGKL